MRRVVSRLSSSETKLYSRLRAMTDKSNTNPKPEATGGPTKQPLPPAAERALAEAAERRLKAEREPRPADEVGGRGGLDPGRYGDWEKAGLTSDF